LPQAIFLLSIFGYLVFCIFFKWSVDWVAEELPAPSLISLLIAFFMSPGTVPPEARLYAGQEYIQVPYIYICIYIYIYIYIYIWL